jgi:hypothetical protein
VKDKAFIWIGLSAMGLLPLASASAAGNEPTLVDAVRDATAIFRNVDEAAAAGYLPGPCVSGPQEGAMGIHFIKGDLVGDNVLDPQHPEALIYEPRNGALRLVGVEFIALAGPWDANNAGPPVLMGQLFQYVGSPNRYAIPAFYELHVWAWRNNPNGMFVDWNPKVSCEEQAADGSAHSSH